MTEERLAELLGQVARHEVSQAEALERLRTFPVEDLTYAQVDHLRPLSQGHPEVVFCEGKQVEQVVGICESLARSGGTFLATRAGDHVMEALQARFPRVEVNRTARTVVLAPDPPRAPSGRGTILVVTAGTSDLAVAEEAVTVARALGNAVELLADVGVAGIHRILRQSDALLRAEVLIVVAGMDGALPSVVGGLVRVPVIAVPTSVGYGASFGGVAALLAMLNSCASGVVVVNIDNGFGAAVAASRINHLRARERDSAADAVETVADKS
jgi:NCAIR mutase (PurE)-related protein